MDLANFNTESITIRGSEVAVKVGFLPERNLLFYPENPRIYSIICEGGLEPTQELIQEKLTSMEHVKQLIQSIKLNGGLHEPIIVRKNIVLEGNSRLAAYRVLSSKDPIAWGKIKCKVLPDDLSDDLVFALLGEYHIIGKKDWAPYEQAGYLYRRFKIHNISKDQIAKELPLTKKMITHLINVYSFMLENNETDISKWSYYNEYLRSNIFKNARETYNQLDSVVVSKIKSGEIPRADELRDKLKVILSSKPKLVNKFISSERNFEESYLAASEQGNNDIYYKKLHIFRSWIVDSDTEEGLLGLRHELKEKCEFELKKINNKISNLLKKIE